MSGADSQGLAEDRTAVAETLYAYSRAVDAKDYSTLRNLFTDDAINTYQVHDGNINQVATGNAIVSWIEEGIRDLLWQHHHLTVYEVRFVSPRRAVAHSYLTSHQRGVVGPDVVTHILGTYDDELVKGPSGWRIASKTMRVVAVDHRPVTSS